MISRLSSDVAAKPAEASCNCRVRLCWIIHKMLRMIIDDISSRNDFCRKKVAFLWGKNERDDLIYLFEPFSKLEIITRPVDLG